MYYEGIYEAPEFKGIVFKIKRIKPTRLFSYQTILAQVFNEEGKKPDNYDEITEKAYDFILENILFSREREGQYQEVKSVGLDNTNLKEIEENPTLIGVLIALFINNVVNPIEKK